MAELIEFTSNYEDLSTETGFQWEFHCERCQSGYRTKFDASATGVVSQALDVASGLIGVLGRVSNTADRIHSATWEKEHDAAFVKAAKEIRPYFIQCPRCNEWVCKDRCWNAARGLCFDCAPDAKVEAASAQAETIADQAREKVRGREYDVEEYTTGNEIQAGCPECGAALKPGAKFCRRCGAKLLEKAYCVECGSEIDAGAKFCPECGAKQE